MQHICAHALMYRRGFICSLLCKTKGWLLGPQILNAIGKSNDRSKACTEPSILSLLVSFRIISLPSHARVNSQMCSFLALRVVLLWWVSRCSGYLIFIICPGGIRGFVVIGSPSSNSYRCPTLTMSLFMGAPIHSSWWPSSTINRISLGFDPSFIFLPPVKASKY